VLTIWDIKGIKNMKPTNLPPKKQKPKKKIIQPQKTEQIPPQTLQANEETALLTLKTLSKKEKKLTEERDQLLDMEATLKKRIVNEIETKKSSIQDLEGELPQLKQRIENLAKLLDIPIVK
jgi:predicted RNase H-like nuclease (RuvC/YqgF family)